MSTEEQKENKKPHAGTANLIPYKPGQSGNPGGRPPGRSVTARVRDLLDACELGGKKLPSNKQVADLVAEALIRGAIKGDARILGMLMDRVEGKVKDATAELTTESVKELSNEELDDIIES